MKTTIELRGADGRMIQSSRFTLEHKGTGAKVNPFAVQQVQLVLKFLLFLAENAVGGDRGDATVVARINP
jgi:hypothetical protein